MAVRKLVGGKIKKLSIFKRYNPLWSLKKLFGLTKKETWQERRKRQKQEYRNWVNEKNKSKQINNNKKKLIKKSKKNFFFMK